MSTRRQNGPVLPPLAGLVRVHAPFHPVLILLLAAVANAAIVDRVAVIVGTRVVKISDIERELRVTSFLNRQPLDESAPAMKKAAERLIDQTLVRQDLLAGQYSQPTEKDAAVFLQQLKRDRFRGSEQEFQSELARHKLTGDQLRRQLLWQLTVLRFIDQRFRPGVVVTDEDVDAWRQQHAAQSRNATTDQLREIIAGERINQAFEDCLAETRRNTRIEYRTQAFIGNTQ
jgi:hypothetical protein